MQDFTPLNFDKLKIELFFFKAVQPLRKTKKDRAMPHCRQSPAISALSCGLDC